MKSIAKKSEAQQDVYPYAFFERNIRPTRAAKVSIMTNALQYGTSIFSGIRGYKGDGEMNIFRLPDHYKRFFDSLKILNTTVAYGPKDLEQATVDLARRNKPSVDFYMRPFAYASDISISPDLSHSKFDVAIYMKPLGEYLPVHSGMKLKTSTWVRPPDTVIPPRMKASGAYMNSALAKAEAVRDGYHDALMLNSRGKVAEASAANFFLVKNGMLVTPPPNEDILEGITRRTVLDLAKDLGIYAMERPIDRSEVYIADEAFVTGTGAQVGWVSEVDGRRIGSGQVGEMTSALQNKFFTIVRGKDEGYRHWLTRV